MRISAKGKHLLPLMARSRETTKYISPHLTFHVCTYSLAVVAQSGAVGRTQERWLHQAAAAHIDSWNTDVRSQPVCHSNTVLSPITFHMPAQPATKLGPGANCCCAPVANFLSKLRG